MACERSLATWGDPSGLLNASLHCSEHGEIMRLCGISLIKDPRVTYHILNDAWKAHVASCEHEPEQLPVHLL